MMKGDDGMNVDCEAETSEDDLQRPQYASGEERCDVAAELASEHTEASLSNHMSLDEPLLPRIRGAQHFEFTYNFRTQSAGECIRRYFIARSILSGAIALHANSHPGLKSTVISIVGAVPRCNIVVEDFVR
jgi:hypothetical protein